MKTNILIAIHYLEIGGAESALIGLLSNLDYSRVNVDLFVYDHRGEMMKYIPDEVNLLPQIGEYSMIERPIAELIRKGYWKIAIARLRAKLQHRRAIKRMSDQEKRMSDGSIFYYVANCVLPYLPFINNGKVYDVAISFLTPHAIVREKVRANKYVAWIHTDYSKVFINSKLEESVWNSYDNIVSISKGTTDSFLSVFPSLRTKIVEIPNLLPAELIYQRASECIPTEMDFDGIKILSIGRFCEAKNYDNLPHMAKILKEKGLRFRWFIIGYGDHSPIDNAIEETKTSDCVIILGKKENPYPYIKKCDIYCQPSRYEGRSVTVEEAKLLCKPVLLTNYPTARHQIEDGETGIICEMDNQAVADALYNIANSPILLAKLSENLARIGCDSSGELERFYELVES